MQKTLLQYWIAFVTFTVFFSPLKAQDQLSCLQVKPAKTSLWFCDGYVDSGLYVNEYGQKNTYNTATHGPDWWSGNTGMLQNVWHSDYQLNQAFIKAGKHLDSSRGWDIGGQAELMYGTDAVFMQSVGLELGTSHGEWADGDYYTAISQMYAEVGYRNLSVKVGKFYTIIGYETINSPDRFFYSLSHMFGMNPATHSGALATWTLNKKLTLFGGWVNGQEKFFDSSQDNAFLGAVNYVFNEKSYVRYALLSGSDRQIDHDYFVNSVVLGIKPAEKWDYTFEWLYRNAETTALHPVLTVHDVGGKYGINQELIYRANNKWSYGFRAEWFYGKLPPYPLPGLGAFLGSDDHHYAFTLGANWKPTPWLLIKPEIRYDKYEHSPAFNWTQHRPQKDQFSGGFSTVITF